MLRILRDAGEGNQRPVLARGGMPATDVFSVGEVAGRTHRHGDPERIQGGRSRFPGSELFQLPGPDPVEGVVVVVADTVELPDAEPPEGEDRPLELVPPWRSTT